MFSTRNISPNYSVTIDSTPPRPRHPYGAFLCDDLHRAHYGTSSHVEAISCHEPTTRRDMRGYTIITVSVLYTTGATSSIHDRLYYPEKNPVCRDRTHVPTCQKVARLPLSYRGDRRIGKKHVHSLYSSSTVDKKCMSVLRTDSKFELFASNTGLNDNRKM